MFIRSGTMREGVPRKKIKEFNDHNISLMNSNQFSNQSFIP